MWDRGEFQDPKGTEEIQVRCLQMDPHLENLENQDNQDPKDLKESRGVQVPENTVSTHWCYTYALTPDVLIQSTLNGFRYFHVLILVISMHHFLLSSH